MSFSGLTPSIVLRDIRRKLGAVAYDLELSDDEIMRVVFQITLPVFSKYFPYRYRVIIGPKDEIVGGKACYVLPQEKGMEIMGVSKVLVSNQWNYTYNSYLAAGMTNPYDSQLSNDFASITMPRVTWHTIGTTHIEIYPRLWGDYRAMITLKSTHPKHLRSIKDALREEFLKLAYLDVLESIYPIRKRFETLNSPVGTISLFMESVERAHDEREQLLQSFQENVLRSGDVPRIFIG